MVTYEISTSGVTWSATTDATTTVLVLTVGDTTGLESSLGRLADLGFELQSVRRAPAPPRSGPGTTGTPRRRPGATWEVRVLGRVGPVLLHAVPHDHASFSPRHRTVVATTTDDLGIVDVLATVLTAGARLESLRARGDVTLDAKTSAPGQVG